MLWRDRTATAVAPTRPRRRQPGLGALSNQVTFKLGQRREDVEEQLPVGRRGVYRLAERLEADPAFAEMLDQINQVAD